MSVLEELRKKEARLEEMIRGLGSAAVAFSAGVDSSYLAYTAHRVLGGSMAAVTADISSFPKRELEESAAFCRRYGIKHIVIRVDQLGVEGFADNPPDRCYLCKKAVFGVICAAAGENGMSCVIEGSNLDDMSDYRPGLKAIAELDIRSPLVEAGLTKSDIRALSREHGLPTWDKPSFACLATRIPYGDRITKEKLDMIDLAEQKLSEMGFRQFRVRVHGRVARIELPQEDMPLMLDPEVRRRVNEYFTRLGFSYAALDLGGYKTGNMNRVLSADP